MLGVWVGQARTCGRNTEMRQYSAHLKPARTSHSIRSGSETQKTRNPSFMLPRGHSWIGLRDTDGK